MDHTALLVLAIQRSAGNKHVQFNNPYAYPDPAGARAAFKQLYKGQKR